jgi:hypothetical protein
MSAGAPTIGALKRLTYDPANDNFGDIIAGQNYWGINFTGGEISNVVLTNCTLIPSGGGGGVTEQVEFGGNTTVSAPLNSAVVQNNPAIARKTVNIPRSTGSFNIIIIVDGQNNAAAGTNDITPVPASGSIINANAAVVYTPGGSVTLIDLPAGWFATG